MATPAIWDMRPAQRASRSRLRLAVAKSDLRSDARGEALCHRAEAVVGVAEIGGDAAARGTTRELDVVPPRAASGRASDAVRGASRVLGGRGGVVGRIVPIAPPLVNVLAHVKEAVTVGLTLADGFGSDRKCGPPARQPENPKVKKGPSRKIPGLGLRARKSLGKLFREAERQMAVAFEAARRQRQLHRQEAGQSGVQ